MPLNNVPVGKAIADYFVSQAPAPGTPVSEAQLEAIWEGAMGILYDDVKANADVSPVSHAATPLTNPAGQAIAVTSGPGAGSAGDTSAPEVIVGTGSIL